MHHDSPHPVFAAERAARRAAAQVQDRNLAYYATRPEEIETRLAELDSEMDIERAMDVYGLRAAVAGGVLSIFRGRSWALLPLAAAVMLGLQATTGDSGLRRLLRRMGYRTAREIAAEEDALMSLLDEKTTATDATPKHDGPKHDGPKHGGPPPPLAEAPRAPVNPLI